MAATVREMPWLCVSEGIAFEMPSGISGDTQFAFAEVAVRSEGVGCRE